ncbi:POLE2 [Acanthosepion pharaonis]|uniref:DNA polymerase II subunit 2 n=1 Tax=Acanthosepion pharaonis TaxID=158019 RepID=A0A812EMN0_ACAPH|nr:POLE2 [Sepia pharaonis]
MNFFGGPLPTSAKASASLRHLESENQDAMFIFLSDVWLDQPKVIHKLKVLFSGYYECPPVAFVFCGNFTSSVHLSKQGKILKDCFSTLADIISKYPTLVKSCRFIFVPGPHDPGPANILPRPAIPNSITEEFRKKVPNAIFTSNPCRIQYCTQEIVIIREDIVTKLCRNCIHFPASGDVPTHFAKTVICQSHLCPLPLHVCPIYWAYDCGMHLYPLPDLLVVADKYDEFTVTSVDCMIMNPGCFPQSDFSFKAYMPYTRQIENSKID